MDDPAVTKIVDKVTDTDAETHHPQGYLIEPSLLPSSSQLLPSYSVSGWKAAYPPYLKKRVQRNPRDLRAHVQRTFLHLSQGDSDAVYSSLVDLFLILGRRGRPLRENLLGRARVLLSDGRYNFLVAHLDWGLDVTEQIPDNPNASLSKALSGTLKIVRRQNDDGTETNPLHQARVWLSQNNVLSAQAILEHALNVDPGNDAITRELLHLYKKFDARDAFFNTYTALSGRRLALPDLWREAESYFLGR